MTQIYFLKPDAAIDTAALAKLLPLVSAARGQRVEQGLQRAGKQSIIRQKLDLYAELLLRCVAARQLGADNAALVLAHGEHGKPYLNGFEDFYFNWSHTKDALALAVSDSPVGVDVELVRPADEKLAGRFFTEAEAAYVTSAMIPELRADVFLKGEWYKNATADQHTRFFQIWTRKEAYTKYTGSGLSVPLNVFDVLTDAAVTSLLHTKTHSGYVLSLCAKHAKYEWIELTETQLITWTDALRPCETFL